MEARPSTLTTGAQGEVPSHGVRAHANREARLQGHGRWRHGQGDRHGHAEAGRVLARPAIDTTLPKGSGRQLIKSHIVANKFLTLNLVSKSANFALFNYLPKNTSSSYD